MQRFTPIITIWVVEFTDKNYGTFIGQEHFLFYRRAKKYYEERLKDSAICPYVNISLSGKNEYFGGPTYSNSKRCISDSKR